ERCDVERSGFEHLEHFLRDAFGMAEVQLLDALKIFALDEVPAEVTPQVVGAVAAARHDLDGFARRDQPLRIDARELSDIRIEAAAQTTLCRHDDQQMHLVLASANEKRRRAD